MNESSSTPSTKTHPVYRGPAYEEMVDLIASGATPQNLIAFRPSQASKDRVRDLIEREKTVGLSAEETSELENYLQLEHFMRLVKARAQKYASGPADALGDREAS